jgi:hypothetical protein
VLGRAGVAGRAGRRAAPSGPGPGRRPAAEVSLPILDIRFANGRSALAVQAPSNAGGEELVSALGLPVPAGTMIVNGSTALLAPEVEGRLTDVLEDGLAALAVKEGLTVVTGATDAGIFAALGAAMDGHHAPLVGVAPQPLVTWPGRTDEGPDPMALTPLEPHHTHFVLVDAQEWGDETGVLMSLAAALAASAPAVVVLFGGGRIAAREAEAHLAAGRRVVAVAGSVRLADRLVAAIDGGPSSDPQVAAIAASSLLTVLPADGGPQELIALLRRSLEGPA